MEKIRVEFPVPENRLPEAYSVSRVPVVGDFLTDHVGDRSWEVKAVYLILDPYQELAAVVKVR